MEYTVIDVPDMNDCMLRVVLSGVAYLIRFTYNDTYDYWKFSLYTSQQEPLAVGIKIVPNFPLNLFTDLTALPSGVFGVMTNLDHVGRNDFINGKANFVYCPVET